MSDLIFEKEYEVNSVNININKNLGLFGILGILQDVGTIQAELMGVGFDAMVENNAFWVFTQQKLKMKKWPKWQDKIQVKTWPRKLDGLKAYRDFTIHFDGEQIGEAVATIMVLDGATRRPTPPKLDDEILKNIPEKELDINTEKIIVPEGMEVANTIKVRNSDLDMNNHVNNTKYSQWILDTIPLAYHRKFVASEFDINFLAETRLGEEVDIAMVIEEGSGEVNSFYQGTRKSDGKVVFTSRIKGIEP